MRLPSYTHRLQKTPVIPPSLLDHGIVDKKVAASQRGMFVPSQALQDFRERLKEVQELLEAHSALTGLRNAQAALNAGGQTLQNVAQVVQHLVSAPGRGRPRQVQALNSAGIALLSAHLQGFLVDLHIEVAR